MRKILLSLILCITIGSCETRVDRSKRENIEELIATIINHKGTALPPPPSFSGDSLLVPNTQKIIDSIKNVKLNIAIYPILDEPTLPDRFDLSVVNEDFKSLLGAYSKLENAKLSGIEDINNMSRHNVILADTSILKKSKDWQEYDIVFKFSNISFNNKFDRAAINIGVSRSALWGYGGTFLFEKIDGEWTEVKSFKYEKW